jgi:hypothetical protein
MWANVSLSTACQHCGWAMWLCFVASIVLLDMYKFFDLFIGHHDCTIEVYM